MESLFARSNSADPAWLAEELPGPGRSLGLDDRADCCPARPLVTVIMPPVPGRRLPTELLLCGHHYRVSSAALRSTGATMYDVNGAVIAPGDDGHLTARAPVPPPDPASRRSHARRGRL